MYIPFIKLKNFNCDIIHRAKDLSIPSDIILDIVMYYEKGNVSYALNRSHYFDNFTPKDIDWGMFEDITGGRVSKVVVNVDIVSLTIQSCFATAILFLPFCLGEAVDH